MRDTRLLHKTVIVTGAGSQGEGIGNGRATAILMARSSARVALLDSRIEAAETTRKIIEAEGGTAIVIECDVADPAACGAAVEKSADQLGDTQVLVNNVGIGGPPGTAVDVDPLEWDRAMAINVKSMMLMAKYAIPHMIKAGGGAIVNMASITGVLGGFPDLFYPTSKAAVINMTRAMAAHHGKDGIRVNCIAPGLVYTPYVVGAGMSDEVREQRRLQTVLGTEGTAWDVGMAAVFLASDEARWITGVTLPVDAGDSAIKLGVPFQR